MRLNDIDDNEKVTVSDKLNTVQIRGEKKSFHNLKLIR